MFPKTKKGTLIVSFYLTMTIVSWFLISGWEFAQVTSDPLFKTSALRKTSGNISVISIIGAFLWPLALPAEYGETGYAEHGWRALWDFSSPKPVDLSGTVKGQLPVYDVSGRRCVGLDGTDCIVSIINRKEPPCPTSQK
jgi:hypothetical protein